MQVFYSPMQNVEQNNTFSPSAGKPQLFVDCLQFTKRKFRWVTSKPVSKEDLYRAHEQKYVDDVLSLRVANGFGNFDAHVARSLPYTSGSMLDAAKAAIAQKTVTCSPTSGFHHAGHAWGGGFCTFNGLMVTALHLKAHGLAQKVAIVDCDEHYGNGTEDIIETLGCRPWCYSTDHAFSGKRHKNYLTACETVMREVVAFAPDVILYQAGADVHEKDPLGGSLSTAEMAERDHIVFAAAREANIPIAWNLAGGYQKAADGSIQAVLDLHLQSFDVASKMYGF